MTLAIAQLVAKWCRRGESNPYAPFETPDFESGASASSATPALKEEGGRYQTAGFASIRRRNASPWTRQRKFHQIVDFGEKSQGPGHYSLLDFKDGRKVDHVGSSPGPSRTMFG